MDPSTPGDAPPPGAPAAAERAAWPAVLARLSGGLSHEARNPLHAMALQVALLAEKLEGPAAEVAAPHLAALRAQVARIDELLKGVAAPADPGLGPLVDVAGLVRLAVRMHGPALRPGRLRAEVQVAEGTRPLADPDGRLPGMVALLLGVALAEVADGGTLRVEVDACEGGTAIRLSYPPRDADRARATAAPGLDTAAGLALDLAGRLTRRVGPERVELLAELPEGGAA